MRPSLCGNVFLAAAGLLALTLAPAIAQQPTESAFKGETQLLGVHVMRTFRDVLQKHGPPTRIEVGQSAGTPGGGNLMSGGGAMMGGGGRMGAMMGGGGMSLPGMSGMGMTSPGGPPMGGKMGAMMGSMMGGGGGGQRMGAMLGGMANRGPGGDDELPMGMGPGGSGVMGRLGGGGIGGGQAQEGEGEVTWVYERGPLTYHFLFNKDGRVIQISEFGYSGGSETSRHIKLGDQANKIYSAYGWADSTVNDTNQLMLDYSNKHHVAFQLLDNGKGMRVVGIIVALTEAGARPIMGRMGTGNMMGGGGMMGAPMMGGGMMGRPSVIPGGGNPYGGRLGAGPGGGGGRGKFRGLAD